MGLDMYAYTAPNRAVTQPVNFKLNAVEGLEDLHYWRKHPNLHGFMEDLYYAKGGTSECFNCDPLVLTLEDLIALEQAIREGLLPQTDGFFFGATDGTEKDDDLLFIQKARAAIAEGKTVIYDSWW
jgi:hypothetical protein